MKNIYPKLPETSASKRLKKAIVLLAVIFELAAMQPGKMFAQSPLVFYGNPQTFTIGTAASLSPTIAGAAPPAYSNTKFASGLSNNPAGLAVDGAGNVYVTNNNFSSPGVTKIPAGGGAPLTLYSAAPNVFLGGVAVDAAGNVFVTDYYNNTLVEIPAGGGAAQTITTGLYTPTYVALDAAGNIYVVDQYDQFVERIRPGGGPAGLFSFGFSSIAGLAVGPNGDVYIADSGANAVYKVPPAGGNPVKVADVMGATGVARDGTGNLYVIDTFHGRLVEIPADGSAQVTIANNYAGSLNPIVSDAFGNLYAPDSTIGFIMNIAHSGGYYTNGLPPGLILNNTTGVISGTPTASSLQQGYLVRAYNGAANTTTSVGITVIGTGLLSNLSLSGGTLGPAFSPATNSYSTTVAPGTTSLQVIPKTTDTNAVIKVNGMVVKSGVRSAAIPLVQGSNSIFIVVTPAYGPANTYVINANLSNSPLPSISYNSPQSYATAVPIAPLSPTSNLVAAYGINTVPQNWQPHNAAPVGVAADVAGNIYINYSDNDLVKVPVGGGPIVMSQFTNGLLSIVADAAGNVYACNRLANQIFKIPAAGGIPILFYSLNSGTIAAIAVDNAGNLYLPEPSSNKIMKVPAGGGTAVVAYNLNSPAAIAFDKQGNTYIVYLGSGGSYDLYKYPANGGTPVYLGLSLDQIFGLTVDAAGNVFEAGYKNAQYTIIEVVAGTNQQVLIGNYPNFPSQITVDGAGNVYAAFGEIIPLYKFVPTGGYFINNLPAGLSFSSNTGIISGTPPRVTPATNYTITGYNASGGTNTAVNIAVTANTNLSALVPGTGTLSPAFSSAVTNYTILAGSATQITLSPTVADPNATVKVNGTAVTSGAASAAIPLSPGTNVISVVVTAIDASQETYTITAVRQPTLSYSSPQTYSTGFSITPLQPNSNGVAPPAYGVATVLGSGFSDPYGIAIDAAGDVYVADQNNNTVTKLPAGGGAVVNLGSGFNKPRGIAVDAAGNVYVADFGSNTVKKIPVGGGSVTTLASGFNLPDAVAVDAAGNVYVADYANGAVKKIPAGGGAIVSMGTGFVHPETVALDAKGNIYVADAGSTQIKEILASDGSTVTVPSPLNSLGFPTAATVDLSGNIFVVNLDGDIMEVPASGGTPFQLFTALSLPTGVVIDASQNIFVADQGHALVKELKPTGGYFIDKPLPAGLSLGIATGIISGTPSVFSPAANYTIAGYNTAGNASSVLNLAVINNPIVFAPVPAVTYGTADFNPGATSSQPLTYASSNPSVATIVAGNIHIVGAGTSTITATSAGAFLTQTLTVNPTALTIKANPQTMVQGAALPTFTATYTGLVNGDTPSSLTTQPTITTTATPSSPAGLYPITVSGAISANYVISYISDNLTILFPAPNISYSSPQTYYTNLTIPTLTPTNTGGAVPLTTYDYVSVFAGSGAQGSANGTGNAATFKYPIGIATDVQGNVYVCDAANNLIRQITPDGVVTTYAGSGAAGSANGVAASASFNNPTGIAVDAQGNVYVGDEGNYMIRKITPGGTVSTLAGSGTAGSTDGTGTAASFNHPRGLAIDAQGDVYVADYYNNLIRKITAAGVVTTFAGSGTAGSVNGTGTAASFNAPLGVATDILGNIYVADGQNHLIRKITPAGVVSTLAGSGAMGNADGTGIAASFGLPFSVTTDVTRNVYVADMTNNSIRKITPAGVVTTLAGGTSGSAGGIGTQAKFNLPQGISADNQGNLFIADDGNQLIRKLYNTGYSITPALPDGLTINLSNGVISGTPTSASTTTNYAITAYNTGGSSTATLNIAVNSVTAPAISYAGPQSYPTNIAITPLAPSSTGGSVSPSMFPLVSTFAGSGGCGIVDGTGTAAAFCNPPGVATDAQGNVYVADQIYNVIRKISPAGAVTTIAGTLSAGFVNGTGTAASFNQPIGVAADLQGNVYVADTYNQAIRKIDPAGVVTTLAGNGTSGSANGTGTGASFSYPYGAAVDLQGNVYVADLGNRLVRKITPAGVVTTLAGGGPGLANDGTGTAASFAAVNNVATDPQGNVYVADGSVNKIRKITPAGVVTTFAGSGASGSANGAGTAATFNFPRGVAVDSQGNVYVSETGNNDVRKITPAGVVSTVAGNGTAGAANGIGTAATFSGPSEVAVDGGGNLYIADYGNNKIRKIVQTGYSIIPALPAGLSIDGTTGTISGTPTAVSAAANYVVTANNVAGSANAIVNIRVASTAANLSSLVLSTGALTPGFSGFTTSYTASVANSTTSIKVTPTAANPPATITVNGVAVASGLASQSLPLSVGPNIITTVVTAQDGTTTQTYTITVTRAASTNTNLANLKINNGSIALSPAFNYLTTGYTASVTNTTTSVTVTPVTSNATATVKINGATVASKTASASLPLVVGANTITTVVTAQDGTTTKTYTITVTRAPSANAALAGLKLSAGTLSPVFATGTNSYTATVAATVSSVTLTPTTSDATATVKVNGTTVTSGTASAAIPLNTGTNTITTVVTAQDGVTTQTYTVTIGRGSSNTNLTNLKINAGAIPLTPSFIYTTTSYTASVPNATASIKVTPAIADANATVKINGTPATSGTASAAIPLNFGPNTITTVVTAQDGTTTKTYTITVTRAPSANAALAGLKLSAGTLSPVFAAGTNSYTATVAATVSSVTLTPTTSDATATVKVNGTAVTSGTASAAIPLNTGTNTITTVVTAQDGTTTQTYTVTIGRGSSNTNLTNLKINAGAIALTPSFIYTTTSYTASVPNATASIKVTPAIADANATVKINGTPATSGTASAAIPLNFGPNTITTVVTAQDGISTKTYTITVTRPAQTNADLAGLKLSAGTLSPAFTAATTGYTAYVANAIASVTITPAAADAGATITVNGTAVTSGTASGAIALAVGPNTINIVVTAQDGTTTKTYTVTVNRMNVFLSNLKINNGAITLTPGFSYATTSYTASVTNTTATIKVTPALAYSGSTVTINGIPVTSGTASGAIALTAGPNTINAVVTGADGTTTRTYTITVTRASGPIAQPLENVSVQKPMQNPPIEDDIIVHQGISPNDDGANDYLVIDGITNYPDNRLMIMNRNGTLVYEARGYDNSSRMFDGHSSKTGAKQLPGTYFYSLEYKVKGVIKHKAGFIVLKY